jgi:hypothetical protein
LSTQVAHQGATILQDRTNMYEQGDQIAEEFGVRAGQARFATIPGPLGTGVSTLIMTTSSGWAS